MTMTKLTIEKGEENVELIKWILILLPLKIAIYPKMCLLANIFITEYMCFREKTRREK